MRLDWRRGFDFDVERRIGAGFLREYVRKDSMSVAFWGLERRGLRTPVAVGNRGTLGGEMCRLSGGETV